MVFFYFAVLYYSRSFSIIYTSFLQDSGIEEKSDSGPNGWDPQEMFDINKNKFNVQSTYNSSLPEYTLVFCWCTLDQQSIQLTSI